MTRIPECEKVKFRSLFLLMLMVSTCFSIGVAGPRPEDAITEDALKAHIQFLSDDLLEGRGTATRGHEIAAKYVAEQFEAMGLKPAGDQGPYFQRVPFRQAIFQSEKSSVVLTVNGSEQPLGNETD